MSGVKSEHARIKELSKKLVLADKCMDWDIYNVKFDKSVLRRSPSVLCEDSSVTVNVPFILSRVPFELMGPFFDIALKSIKGERDLTDLDEGIKEYLSSKKGRFDLRNIYKELGLIADYTDLPDTFNNTLRAIQRNLAKGSIRKSEIRSIELRWAGEKPLGYAAYGLPYGRIVVLDRSLGPWYRGEAEYAVYHEICYVLAYSVEKDRLNKKHFRELIREFPKWYIMEQMCNAEGYRFRNSPIVSKEGDRW